MKKGKVEIVMVIDKSGSMESMKRDAIGGFNSFLQTQQDEPGEALLTTVMFSDIANVVGPIDIREVNKLSAESYVPGGSTALFDAIGTAIDDTGRRLRITKEEERPEKVIFVIITDGEENSSRWYSRAKIKHMIEHQQDKYSWEFHYLGANQDAFKEASSMGVYLSNTSNYDVKNIGATYATTINTTVLRARRGTSTTKNK